MSRKGVRSRADRDAAIVWVQGRLRMKAVVKCHCGQRIFSRDVVQQGYYIRKFGPSYVYLRFRCSRCKKLGEHFIKHEEWQASLLQDDATEATDEEILRFDRLGPITAGEMAEFHGKLSSPNALSELTHGENR
jgi:hypothetical protein